MHIKYYTHICTYIYVCYYNVGHIQCGKTYTRLYIKDAKNGMLSCGFSLGFSGFTSLICTRCNLSFCVRKYFFSQKKTTTTTTLQEKTALYIRMY